MLEELVSELDRNQKISIVKYASVFAGGIIVGYSIKKFMDSHDFDVIKSNAMNLADDYINPKGNYDLNAEEIVDEEDLEE